MHHCWTRCRASSVRPDVTIRETQRDSHSNIYIAGKSCPLEQSIYNIGNCSASMSSMKGMESKKRRLQNQRPLITRLAISHPVNSNTQVGLAFLIGPYVRGEGQSAGRILGYERH